MAEGKATYETREAAEAAAEEAAGQVIKMPDGSFAVVPANPAPIGDYFEKPEKRAMGGAMVDELGYMRGGMTEEKRGPIKYAVGGAIKGKNFKGSF